MSVDVVVVAYNSAAVLERCLDAVARLHDVEQVIIVDHGSDGSGDRARERGAVVVQNPENPGYGAGQNRGRNLGTAQYVLMLNPDAEIEPAAVAKGRAVLDAQPSVGAVQGAISAPGGRVAERSAGRALGPIHLWGRALGLRSLLRIEPVRRLAARVPLVADHATRTPSSPTEVESLAAVAVLARRDAIESVGGFDEERYFLYGEDIDLSLRLRQAGWGLLALPDAWATHINGASSASSWDREIEWWRGTLAYGRRWWSAWQRGAGVAAALVMIARLVAVRPRQWRRALGLLRPIR